MAESDVWVIVRENCDGGQYFYLFDCVLVIVLLFAAWTHGYVSGKRAAGGAARTTTGGTDPHASA